MPVNSKDRTLQPRKETYYANAKLYSHRMRKRPINRVSGLTRFEFSDSVDEKNISVKVKQKELIK